MNPEAMGDENQIAALHGAISAGASIASVKMISDDDGDRSTIVLLLNDREILWGCGAAAGAVALKLLNGKR